MFPELYVFLNNQWCFIEVVNYSKREIVYHYDGKSKRMSFDEAKTLKQIMQIKK